MRKSKWYEHIFVHLVFLSVRPIVFWLSVCARFHIETLDLFSVGNMMMTDSSAVYAPAVCPNRTPIQGVQQNDQMHGN